MIVALALPRAFTNATPALSTRLFPTTSSSPMRHTASMPWPRRSTWAPVVNVKMNRESVVGAALDLLDEVGLDAVSTRRLAKRLGVEQRSLYYHFRNKKELSAPWPRPP